MIALPALAIVAGGGVFPAMIAKAVSQAGTKVFVVHLQNDSDHFAGYPSMSARPEQMSVIFAALKERGISDLVLIGHMNRPKISDLRPDWFTIKLLPRIVWQLAFGGDDALLRSVRTMLEKQGFRLHAANDFIKDLTAPAGAFSRAKPDDAQMVDIRMGIDAARAHGAKDAGQAVVVRRGAVTGREEVTGTDALIRSFVTADGAILVKMAKPQQDRALDLPTIGPDTVRLCAERGFAGIAVEAGATLVANREEVTKLADQYGLFLVGVK